MATLQETLTAGFESRGAKQRVDRRTSRYLVYFLPDRPERLYFLGVGGSLRAGSNRTKSLPCTDTFKLRILEDGRVELARRKTPKVAKSLVDLGL